MRSPRRRHSAPAPGRSATDVRAAARAAAGELIAAALRLDEPLAQSLQRESGAAFDVGEPGGPHGEPHVSAPDLGSLAARAHAVAASAVPIQTLTLSLCMIVRDEQDTLARCLESVADAVDEIVILDTGSRDRTIEIALSFGARVIERAWTQSFALARNASLEAARGDWLVYLDADEVLCEGQGARLRALTRRTWREAFYVCERSHTGEPGEGSAVSHEAMRVFRNRPEYRFEGRVHEQIAHRLPAYLPDCVEHSDVCIEHFGYLAAVRDGRGKSRRNIELLRLQRDETPLDPFLHFNLGSEYAAAGDAAGAVGELELAWGQLDSRPASESREFAPALAARLVAALRACGRPRDAIARAEQALGRFPGFTDLVLEQALAAGELGDHAGACELLERCIEMGDAPTRYAPRAGAGSYLPRVALAERLMLVGDLAGARAQLEACLREHASFPAAVASYARVLLAEGLAVQDVATQCERSLREPSAAARTTLGEVLLDVGATRGAEAQFAAALAAGAGGARTRAGLGEALLLQRRYREAGQAFAAIADRDALAGRARRGELLACLAAGGGCDRELLERAREAGTSACELAVFEAWRELLASGSFAGELSAQAGEALAALLDTLLRAQDFTAFETLAALLAQASIDPRERRELLAEMYLRRGYTASAAEEWMAVCAEQPDAAALVGLARVAQASGMQREAAEFAAAALECAPEDSTAALPLGRAAAGA